MNFSNRLKKTEKYSTKYYDLAGEYSFDPDGNFLTHTRSFNGDNFNYDYYPYTNRLRKVTGTENQFTYDYNGNMTNDYLNNNTDIKYDHRNLIIEITKYVGDIDPPATYTTTYKYDEAGNRIQKSVLKNDGTIQETIVNEFYVRDAQGKEIAIYQDYELDFWNVFGMGNEGRITSEGIGYFYHKDHLGSVRAVEDEFGYLTEAQDYDAWGYLFRMTRGYSEYQPYKFTGKELDHESKYHYFGARYYNSRTAVWQSTDPLFEKHIQFTTYNYVLGNPIILIDPDGRQIDFSNFNKQGKSYMNDIIESLSFITGFEFSFQNGLLDIKKNSKISNGSEIARQYIKNAIRDKLSVEYSEEGSKSQIGGKIISLDPKQIDSFISGAHRVSDEALGFGMTFMEEIIHSKAGLGIDHFVTSFGQIDDVVKETNKIRNDLNLGSRLSYHPLVIETTLPGGEIIKSQYLPFDKESLEIMQNVYSKHNESFDLNSFNNFLIGTKFIKY